VKRRLLLSYLVLTLLTLLVLMVPLAVTYDKRARENLEAGLTRDAFVLAAYVEDTLAQTNPADLKGVASSYQQRTDARVVIVDRNGDVLADSSPPVDGPRNFADRPEFADALDSRVATGTRPSDTLGTSLLYVAVPVTSSGQVHGAVRLTYSTAQLDQRVHRYWMLLAGIAAVSLGAAAAVGLLLARWVGRPVERLQAAATALGNGELESRAPTESGPPELRELAAAFNAMAGRLQDLLTSQEQFVADASHQLRTPLTAVRLRLEMLEDELSDSELDSARVAEDIAAARGEAARLDRLVDGLLALATAERVGAPTRAAPTRLATVVTERVEAWAPVAAERGIRVEAVPRELVARVREDRLTQVVDNLIANAIDASQAGGTIRVEASTPLRAERHDGMVELHVIDEGRGMTPEQRARAFDRFWREDSNPGQLGGSGLGLAIVQKLVHADGGSVALLAAPSGGVDAVVLLPVSTDRALATDSVGNRSPASG
jgi:signal transduction histidine kinase